MRSLKEEYPRMPRKPDKPGEGEEVDLFAVTKYKQQLDVWAKKFEKYEQDKSALFQLILRQCDPAMKNKVKALPEFANLEKVCNVVGLLKKMKELAFSTIHSQLSIGSILFKYLKSSGGSCIPQRWLKVILQVIWLTTSFLLVHF